MHEDLLKLDCLKVRGDLQIRLGQRLYLLDCPSGGVFPKYHAFLVALRPDDLDDSQVSDDKVHDVRCAGKWIAQFPDNLRAAVGVKMREGNNAPLRSDGKVKAAANGYSGVGHGHLQCPVGEVALLRDL